MPNKRHIHTKAFRRLVAKLKRQQRRVNAYALATVIMRRKHQKIFLKKK